MGKSYGRDLREKALRYLEKHGGTKTSVEFGISRKVLYDWEKLKRETGSLNERKRAGRPSGIKNHPEFSTILEQNCDKSSREIAEILGYSISRRTVINWLHKLGYSFKKNVLPSEAGRKSTRIVSKDQKTI